MSIGVPTYNRPAELARTLDRLRSLTYQNIEIIVSDNASVGDETAALLSDVSKSDARVRYFRQPVNIGASDNFKFVLSQARGPYFCWFADDDSCELEFVSELASVLDDNLEVGLVMSDVRIIHEMESKVSDVLLSSIRLPDALKNWDQIRRQFFLYPPPNIFFCFYGLYRTEVARRCRLNLASRWKSLAFSGEVSFLAQVSVLARIVSIPKSLKIYRSHKDSAYVIEMGEIGRLDRKIRELEVRLETAWAAIGSNLEPLERLTLAAYPWPTFWRARNSSLSRALFGVNEAGR